MINDGHYKLPAFSLKQHHIPATAELLENNDVELSIWLTTPKKIITSPGSQKYRDLLMTMNDKLNQLTAAEIGEDDGSYAPV